MTRTGLALRVVLVAVFAGACLDPVFDPDQDLAWGVCCTSGVVDTCQCAAASCGAPFRPCALGTCAPAGVACVGYSGSGGGSGGGAAGGTGGGSGGGAGGGMMDAGSIADAGTVSDAGTAEDAGVGGGAGGGGGGGTGGGGGSVTTDSYELCCPAGRITTCVCPQGVCSAPAYRACAGGACVASGSACP